MTRRTLVIVVSTLLAVTLGAGPYAYFGSRLDGDIYRVSLRTGRGSVLSQGPGTPSLGLKVDERGRLFVAGGSGGSFSVRRTRASPRRSTSAASSSRTATAFGCAAEISTSCRTAST